MDRSGRKIKVLIIDDSAVIRQLLTQILNDSDGIEVVGTAADPILAENKINNLKPDVITLDVEMPKMDGLTFLERLMKTNPLPVVMVSSLTQKSCETTLRALELGAVDYVSKPTIDITSGITELSEEIVGKVKIAAKAHVRKSSNIAVHLRETINPSGHSALDTIRMSTTDKIIAIGASTGGTQALNDIITALPESLPGIVVVQHMPPVFTRSYAVRLNMMSRLEVKEAKDGDRVLRGTALIAPGGRHMSVKRNGAMYYVQITDGPPVNYVKPAVDILFRSVAMQAGKNAVGVILTGMGEDGARGLKEMKDAGALTIAQDEGTCVVFGMPKKAIEMGGVDKVLPLQEIANAITVAGH